MVMGVACTGTCDEAEAGGDASCPPTPPGPDAWGVVLRIVGSRAENVDLCRNWISQGTGKRVLSYLITQMPGSTRQYALFAVAGRAFHPQTTICKKYIKASLEGTKFLELLDSETLAKAGSLQEVEQAVVCPLHGYPVVDEYYQAVSPHPFLSQIAVPTLILHTEDDPWVRFEPQVLTELQNPRVFAATTRRGGHLGWRSDEAGKGTWADNMAAQFCKAAASHW
ncbi:ABHD3 [Symbiodinium natans]|uniref:ABHD3 protein n=1 Tax=Symbiodinium natans TaxID=878477 RepID=A0A812MQ76_9DINO|nr:ABHD3 [Symbiodinium natans]